MFREEGYQGFGKEGELEVGTTLHYDGLLESEINGSERVIQERQGIVGYLFLAIGRWEMIESFRQELLKLQAKHKQLLSTRKEVLASLAMLEKRERYCKSQVAHRHITHPLAQSQKSLESPTKQREGEGRAEKRKSMNSQEPQKLEDGKGGEMQQKERERNKRTFGLVSSYLMKAKVNLQGEEQKLKRKAEVQRKVKEEEEQKMRILIEQRAIAIEKQKQSLLTQKSQISNDLLSTQNSILLQKYKIHLSTSDGFITKAQPPIFWKPNKPQELARVKEHTDLYFKKELQRAQEVIQTIRSSEDFYSRMGEDRNSYYQNVYASYLKTHHSYIATEAQPSIYWRPVKHNASTIELQKATKIRLVGEANKPVPQLAVRSVESLHEDSESEEASRKPDLE